MRKLTVENLRELAKKWGMSGYSRLKKTELLSMLRKRLGERKLTELTNLAKKLGIEGYSQMQKSGLVRKISAGFKRLSAQDLKKKKVKSKTNTHKERRTSKPRSGQEKIRTRRVKTAEGRKAEKMKKDRGSTQGTSELPETYGDGRMVLLARDPSWLYCYWDPNLEQSLQFEALDSELTLRITRLTPGGKPRHLGDIPIPEHARSWYLQVDKPGASYKAELGLIDSMGRFRSVMKSNQSDTPPAGPSKAVDVKFGTGAFTGKKSSQPESLPEDPVQLAETMHRISSGPDSRVSASQAGTSPVSWTGEHISSTGGQKGSN